MPALSTQCARAKPPHDAAGAGHARCIDQPGIELRDIARRNLASDALRLLNQHEAALVKAYPMALLEIFAEGPAAAKPHQADASGMDFGELSLVDDAEVQAQVELSRTQQLAVHATDAVLAELNALVSAAQGCTGCSPNAIPCAPKLHPRTAAGGIGNRCRGAHP